MEDSRTEANQERQGGRDVAGAQEISTSVTAVVFSPEPS